MTILARLAPVLRLWLAIVMVWIVYWTVGGPMQQINVPWLCTIGCWACVDFWWALAPRNTAAVVVLPPRRLVTSVQGMLPYALYCLPLSEIPFLGLRFLPRIPPLEMTGATLCAVGVAFAIWARAMLAMNWSGAAAVPVEHALMQRGPYAMVRHPIYLGFVLAQVGMMLTLGEVRVLLFVLGIDRLLKKTLEEEHALRIVYPSEYAQYERRVKRLVPWIW